MATTIKRESAAVRVKRGMKLLDEHGPKEWWRMIDLRSFDITSPCNCIIGSCFSGFCYGIAKLKLNSEGAVKYGFESADCGTGQMLRDYDKLQMEWTTQIKLRKARKKQ